MGNLPIFFSSRQRAEAGRSRPEVWVGETGRGTRATVRGTQKTEPRAGRRVRGAGRGCGTRKTRAWGAGRKTRNTWTRTRARARGHGVQDAGRRTQNTGYRPRAAEHGKRGHEVQKTEDAGTGCRTQNTGYWPRAAEHGKRGHGARETGDGAQETGTSPRAWNATRPHTPARPRNNLPGPFTAGRHPPRAAPYLSRVRIRITPLPPRTPYMLLPRCTSTDLTS